MPALMKSRLGSFSGTSGALGTTVWPRWRKKSRKPSRTWSPVTREFVPATSRSGNSRRGGSGRAYGPSRRDSLSLHLLPQHLHHRLLRKPPRQEEPPRPPAVALATQRAPRPRRLWLSRTRGLDRLGDQRLGQPPGREVRLDAEAAGPARPQRPRALVGEGRVAHPPELAAASDGGGRGLAPVAHRDQAGRQLRLGPRRAREQPRRNV